MRTWTDRSNNFKVDAQFIGLKDNKIHLHKGNGVKIAVPVQKMAVGDLEYVESVTGASLEDDKPLSEVRRKPSTRRTDHGADEVRSSTARAGATISHSKRSDYDWFDFFLQCGVNPQICERYAASFARDEMREESQPDIDSPLLRTLGLKEGDILRVMKYLDNKFGRSSTSAANPASGGNSTERGGSLFSGPGGALKNNTRKGRPAPSNQISDTVDAKALEQYSEESNSQSQKHTTGIAQDDERTGQFDDDAWRPKATSQTQTAIKPAGSATSQAASQKPTVVGSFADLSLLSPPLQPTPAARAAPPVATKQAPVVQQSDLQPQRPPGANSTLFDQVARSTVPQSTGPQYMLEQQGQIAAQPSYPGNVSRQRPAPPLASYQNSLIAPPPARASSAPQDPSQTSVFGPPNLQPQLTGYQGTTAISPGIAPPGQSLQELQQQRTQIYVPNLQTPLAGPAGFMGGGPGQQPYQASFLAQPTGAFSLQQPQATGFMQSNGQQYGPGPQTGTLYPSLNGNTLQSHATGLQTGIVGPASALQAQQTGVNAYLPPAMQPQPTGVARLTAQNFSSIPPVPPLPQQPTMAPLVPQKTGPAPPVRFGVSESAKKLVPQPTGRRANLSQASKFYFEIADAAYRSSVPLTRRSPRKPFWILNDTEMAHETHEYGTCGSEGALLSAALLVASYSSTPLCDLSSLSFFII